MRYAPRCKKARTKRSHTPTGNIYFLKSFCVGHFCAISIKYWGIKSAIFNLTRGHFVHIMIRDFKSTPSTPKSTKYFLLTEEFC